MLYRSIQRLLTLPNETRVLVCHDYRPEGRPLAFESSIGEQRVTNIHVNGAVNESEFIDMRQRRDATLDMPALIIPSLQTNVRAGRLPPAEDNGRHYLRVPLNLFTDDKTLEKLPSCDH